MYKILSKKVLADGIYWMDIEAKRAAKAAKPGQFLIVRLDEKGERIPLTVCDIDKERGSIAIVYQVLGDSTKRMAAMEEGDYFHDVVCPLGRPSELVDMSDEELSKLNILFIAGGVGTAPVYPQVKYLKDRGFPADVIIGTKTHNTLIMEEEMKAVAKELFVCTDDGSYGFNGMVTAMFNELVDNRGKKYDMVIAIGPMIMMKFAARETLKRGIHTIVSLNPIMVDGTGMCGACRVTVGDKVKFACVDGPEFDAALINFDEAMRRQSMYKTQEGQKTLRHEEGASHKSSGCAEGETK
ncbi:sulfide/dihydroorotate dehydrogenase-like FAD/NAD-binding protein [Proteiniclasticum sp. QWL-01]|uniref:sulfide/dihydroorotate dehydrogenase-like FAD/NAD-binding protein n=1 Tax=Proteiniclasticum sp. QWL-01 TaxID=3036945 RepID=UPI0021FF5276|nr:sulfide/dihydroorotate dehydrogenase-like FAD/NAD-binding protein [Proteiniclasticum sp. QWL-01]UUM10987.1 sulfide/dihydroorotate dehydrogenase-like FAD/NAD-binding protein [Clostridiaceae bacterium HFYG-1003]WFF72316.1 sulfide/dihydroorotate dehydrogenase-like FAD/NAD-binding protein [Proteiniclasticum sp. QWL-01]